MSDRQSGELTVADAAARALAALDGGIPVASATVVGGPFEDALGRRLLVSADSVTGSLGLKVLDDRAVELARQALGGHERGLHDVEIESGTWSLYVESQYPIPELVIVGAGHIARPLCRVAAMLGFKVTVLDDRSEFADRRWFEDAAQVRVVDFDDTFKDTEIGPNTYVVLVTRGHKYDYDCILQLLTLSGRPAYLGMIGSRRRVRAAFEALVRDGVDPEKLAGVRAPIGLDIGAETPEEIALAIAAEIVAVRRGGGGGALSQEERVLDRVSQTGRTEQAEQGREQGRG
jgi:xanthine dehydrogenase accessory factor